MSSLHDTAPVTDGMLEDAKSDTRRRAFRLPERLPSSPEEGLRWVLQLSAELEPDLRRDPSQLRNLSTLGEFLL